MVKTTLDERWERVFFWSDRDVLLYESLDLASGVCSQELYRLDFSLSREKDVASDERKKKKGKEKLVGRLSALKMSWRIQNKQRRKRPGKWGMVRPGCEHNYGKAC